MVVTKPPLVVIAGPTASGKSALALAMSRLTPSTVVNADASQVYRDLRILSARPVEEDETETPHRLFGHIDGARACSAAEWAADARTAIAAAHQAGRLPVLAGGTGLYIRTLLDGIAPVPEIDPEVRASVRSLAVGDAHAALMSEDPRAAARLSRADNARIARALEVVRSTGRPLETWQAERAGGIGGEVTLTPLILLPPREWLTRRCDARVEAMMTTGAIAEVEALLARRLSPALPVMRAIGVREITAMLGGLCEPAETIETMKLATRQYAKRQYTWFRNQPPSAWPRHTAQLNGKQIDELAIILRDKALTR